MRKMCAKCKKRKHETEFNWKNKGIRRQHHCRMCSREYIRRHYAENKKYYLKKARIRNKKIRDEANVYIASYLSENPCMDCGETDIVVLEFDHRDRSRKNGNVSRIIRRSGKMVTLIEEISKCDVRCANCHRRKTVKESKGWKLKYAPVA